MDFQPFILRPKKSLTSQTTKYSEMKRDKNHVRISSSNSPYPKEGRFSAAFQKDALEVDASPPLSISRKVHRVISSLNESTVSFGNNRTGSQPAFLENNNSPIAQEAALNNFLQTTNKNEFQDFQVLTLENTKTRYVPESKKMSGLFYNKLHPILDARGRLDMKSLLKLQRREINRTSYFERRPEILVNENQNDSVDSMKNINRLKEDISDILTASRVKSTLAKINEKEQSPVPRKMKQGNLNKSQYSEFHKIREEVKTREKDIVIDARNSAQQQSMSEIDSRVFLELPPTQYVSKASRGKEKQPPKEKIAKNQILKMIVANDKIFHEQAVKTFAQREELLFSKMASKITTKPRTHSTEEEVFNTTFSPLVSKKTRIRFMDETEHDFARVSKGEFIYSRIEEINSLMIKDTKAKILIRDRKSEKEALIKDNTHTHRGINRLRQSREQATKIGRSPSQEELRRNGKKLINQIGIIPTGSYSKEPYAKALAGGGRSDMFSVALSAIDKTDLSSTKTLGMNNELGRVSDPASHPETKDAASNFHFGENIVSRGSSGGSTGTKSGESEEIPSTVVVKPTTNKGLENLFRKARKVVASTSGSSKKLEKSAGGNSKGALRVNTPIKIIDPELQKKLEEYTSFLLKINFSFGIVIKQDPNKMAMYKYYVGAGNNSVLIRNLMKQRWWWIQTENIDSMKDLNFMWTQKKSNKFFEMFGSRRKNPFEGLNMSKKNSKEIVIAEEGGQIENMKKLFTDQEITILRQNELLDYEGLCKLKENEKVQVINDPKALRMCNHLENHFHLSNKKALLWNMRSYFNALKQDVFKHLPLTFHIQNGIEDNEFSRFVDMFNARQQRIQEEGEKLYNIWIIKPGEDTNRGNGIRLSDNLEQIKQMVIAKNEGSNKKRTYLIQNYIHNPLLYKKRKFDIRTYVLVSSINTHLKAYWYEEGYIRTSSKEFSLNNIANREIHLTNNAIQEKAKDYGKFEDGNKVTYEDFQKYLNSVYDNRVNFNQDIYPQLKSLATDAIKSVYGKIDPYRKEHCFEVYGLDFMIDTDFKVWLIEVNTNPDITTCCPILTKLIPNMVENALKLTIDPIFPPPGFVSSKKHQISAENPIENNKFELIFDEIEDAPGLRSIFDIYQKIPSVSASQGNMPVIEEALPYTIEPEEEEEAEEYPENFGKSDIQRLFLNRSFVSPLDS